MRHGLAAVGMAAILTVVGGCAQGSDARRETRAPQTPHESPASVAKGPDSTLPTNAAALRRFEYRQLVMAVEARLVLWAPDEATARTAAGAAFARLNDLDAICSDYRADSELLLLCAGAGGPPVRVSEDLFSVLKTAQEIAAASGGAFDVSCGPAVALWREARRTGVLPAEDARAAALQVSGYRALLLDEAARSVAFAMPGMRLDLGGIAKGYACAQARDVLAQHGVESALVELGGDIAVGAAPPGERGWVIDAGCGDTGHAAGTPAGPTRLVVTHGSVATSGDTSQGVVIDGVRWSHIVDPRTGRALTDALCCTVVAADGAVADALASACRVLGPRAGQALVAQFPQGGAPAGSAAAGGVAREPARLLCEDGSRPLFDGDSLRGWTTRGGRYDGEALWSVEEGCLVGRTGPGAAGGLLYTDTPHTSFELSLQCRLDHPFDSGIFVRMSPDAKGAQITLDDRPGGEIAGLYSDGWIAHARPEAAAAWRRDAWNHVTVRCTGFDMRLQTWINGTLVMDETVPQEFGPGGSAVYAPRGLIGLQVHGGGGEAPDARVRFRDIRLRELPVFGEESLDPARASALGWEELLAGRGGTGDAPGAAGTSAGAAPDAAASRAALSAWEAVDGEGLPRAPDDYRVVDGVLQIPSTAPGGYLRTKANFRNFRLRFDFRQARMSNSGLFLRGRRESLGAGNVFTTGGNPAYSGCEVQLLDDFDWERVTQSTLQDTQFTGSLYGAVAPGVRALRPIGEWNSLEVLFRGSRLAVALNGLALYDVDTHALVVEPQFSLRAPGGFLGLQRYAAPEVEGDTALWVSGIRVQRM